MPALAIPAVIGAAGYGASKAGGLFTSKKETKPTGPTGWESWPEWGKAGAEKAGGWLSEQIGQQTPYTGKFAAELTPGEQALYQWASGYPLDMPYGAGEEMSKTLGGEYLEAPPDLDPYIEAAQRPTTRAYEKSIADLRGRGQRAGMYFSSPWAGEYGEMTEDMGTVLGDIAAKIAYPAWEAERGRMTGAMAMAPAYQAGPPGVAQQLSSILGMPRMVEQAELAGSYQDFMRMLGEPYMPIEALTALLGKLEPTTPGVTEKTTPSIWDMLSKVGGAGGDIAPILMAALGGG